jgi:hypothetical protein
MRTLRDIHVLHRPSGAGVRYSWSSVNDRLKRLCVGTEVLLWQLADRPAGTARLPLPCPARRRQSNQRGPGGRIKSCVRLGQEAWMETGLDACHCDDVAIYC